MVSIIVKHPCLVIDGKDVELGSKIDVSEDLAESLIKRRIAELAPSLEVATPKPKRRKQKAD